MYCTSLFCEADAVKLMLLGLRDSDAVGCMEHGVKRYSAAAASQLNPVDAVFRMAADMSECFSLPRRVVIEGVYVKSKSRTFPALTKQTRSGFTAGYSGALSFMMRVT